MPMTAADAQIGGMASHGCVRMKNDEAEELFRTLSHPDRCPTQSPNARRVRRARRPSVPRECFVVSSRLFVG